MAMSGSGKLKVASMARAADGVKLPLKPYTLPSPKPNPFGLGNPVGLGRPKEDEENRSPENVGDMGGSGGAAVAEAAAAAAPAASGLLAGTFPSAIFSASCRMTALPGDSNPVKEFTHPASPGDNCGNGENESGETPGNGDAPAPCFDSGEKLPNGKSWLGCVVAVGWDCPPAVGAACGWGCGYVPVGRSGGGAILCNLELGGFGPDRGGFAGCEVPVSCCTRERKSLGCVLYTCGASRGCANVGRKPFFILLDDLFTANDAPVFPPFPNSPPSPRSMDIGAAM